MYNSTRDIYIFIQHTRYIHIYTASRYIHIYTAHEIYTYLCSTRDIAYIFYTAHEIYTYLYSTRDI